jgi:molybdate transport system ATP-binding protein
MIEVDVKYFVKDFLLDVSIISDSKVTALFGPSGSGKSTILKLIAGIAKPDSGYISIDNRVLFDSKTGINCAIHKRQVGFVFQDSRLFPHLSVAQNLKFAYQNNSKQTNSMSFHEVVKILELERLLSNHPSEISGGEQQRVAIGRAILSAPELLLLDEPLASLDTNLKKQILPFLQLVTQTVKIPMIYVSHHLDEIEILTSVIVNIENGKSFT